MTTVADIESTLFAVVNQVEELESGMENLKNMLDRAQADRIQLNDCKNQLRMVQAQMTALQDRINDLAVRAQGYIA